MQRIAKVLAAILIVSVALSGCSSFSKQARMQRAHQKYVRKVRHQQAKRVAKANEEANRPLYEPSSPSAPATTITLDPPQSENVAAPVVVNDATSPTP